MGSIIFLLGLPRSGSTLLQRMLSAHPEIKSIAEPWVLLPLLTCFDSKLNTSVYGHDLMERAIHEVGNEYPQFTEVYEEHVHSFITKVYDDLRGGKRYFLDKTPRYYLIANSLKKVFPDAKFIYLFRNPIDIFDSSIDTFCEGRLSRLSRVYFDMANGLNLLTQSINQEQEDQGVQVNYELLCDSPTQAISKVCHYLNIEYDHSMITDYKQVVFKGQFGDPKRNTYDGVTKKSENNKSLSFFRRRVYLRLLRKISDDALNISGYKREILIEQIYTRPSAKLTDQMYDFFGYITFHLSMYFGLPFLLRIRAKQRFEPDVFLN